MSNTTKQRLSVGAVLIGLLGFGVLCFTWSTMPPPEASANPAATAVLTVAPALPVADTADPMATAALAQLEQDYVALTKLAPTSENIDRFADIVARAKALIAGGKLMIDQYVLARRAIVDALTRLGRYDASWQAFREYLTAVEQAHTEQWAVTACRVEADRHFGAGRYHDAMEAYAMLAETWPKCREADEAMYQLAACYLKLGDDRMALDAYKLALYNYPNSPRMPNAYNRATVSAYKLRDLDEAIRLVREFVDKGIRPALTRSMRERLVALYRCKGDLASAIGAAQELRATLPPERRTRIDQWIQRMVATGIHGSAR